jgi:hypothetical protein
MLGREAGEVYVHVCRELGDLGIDGARDGLLLDGPSG